MPQMIKYILLYGWVVLDRCDHAFGSLYSYCSGHFGQEANWAGVISNARSAAGHLYFPLL